MVEYRTRNREVAGSTHTRFTASNLEQVANLLCPQANSASYPQLHRGSNCPLTRAGWPHNALLMPISCHFRDCKALLVTSLTHVSSAIASVQTFTFNYASSFKYH